MGWFRSFWTIGFGQGVWRSDWLGFRIGSCGLVLGLGSGGLARLRGGFPLLLLFDNWIGRKRDVGGGVLAGLCRLEWSGVNEAGSVDRVLKRLLTVTFRNSSRLGSSGLERRETDGFVVCLERMCLELVKNDWGSRGLWEVTSRDKRSQLNLRV